MISCFSHPVTDFDTPYRAITCNSCWNDPARRFDHKDFLWRPRCKNTPRQFECTRLITVEQVKKTIARVAGFGVGRAAGASGISAARCRRCVNWPHRMHVYHDNVVI